MNRDHEDLLRRLTLNDEHVLEPLLGSVFADAEPEGLDGKTVALVRPPCWIGCAHRPTCRWCRSSLRRATARRRC